MQTFLDSVPLPKEKMLKSDHTDNRKSGVNVRLSTGYYTLSDRVQFVYHAWNRVTTAKDAGGI
jgi:hypothetical protein